jgi:hypothetical protein
MKSDAEDFTRSTRINETFEGTSQVALKKMERKDKTGCRRDIRLHDELSLSLTLTGIFSSFFQIALSKEVVEKLMGDGRLTKAARTTRRQ